MAEAKPKFEDALKRLEKLVSEMEGGTLDLDAMLARFEEGKKLAAYCRKELDAIGLRIEKATAAGAEAFSPTGDGEGK